MEFNSRGLSFQSRIRYSHTGIHKILINEIRREDLQPIRKPARKRLRNEKPGIPADPLRNGPNANNRVIGLRRNGILHPIKELPRRNGLLLTQMLHVTLKLGTRQIRIDPIILQIPGTPKRTPGFRGWHLPRLPHADDPTREQLRDRLVESPIVLVDQQIPELLHQVLVELGRVLVPELGPNFEDDDFGLGFGYEFFHVVDDHVDAVGFEASMADPTVLLDPNVQDPGTCNELFVDGAGLALCKRAGDESDPDPVRGGVVRARPDDLVKVEPLRVEAGYPVLAVGRAVLGSGVVGSCVAFEFDEGLLLGGD